MATLWERGRGASNLIYEDEEGLPAFTVSYNNQEDVNGITIIKREQQWSQFHPYAGRGPDVAFLHWGPNDTPGFVHIGSVSFSQSMKDFLKIGRKQNSEWLRSRYFESKDGRKYKWKPAGNLFVCMDTRKNIVATFDPNVRDPFNRAILRITEAGLHMSTEIIVTLVLNRVMKDQGWSI